MKRLVSLLVIGSLALSASGCGFAGLCSESSGGCTNTTPAVHNHYYEDDDDTGLVVLAGAAVGVALIATLIAVGRSSSDDAPQPAAQPAAYVVPAPVAANPEELRFQRMFVQGHLSARAGRCQATRAIGAKLAKESPAQHQVYAADSVIATCLK